MTERHPPAPIRDPAFCHRMKQTLTAMLEPPHDVKENWLLDNGWIVVAVESAAHFDEHDAETLAAAMRAAGHEDCLAVAAEPLDEFPECLRIPTTKAGLLGFSHEAGHFNFVLTTETLSFAVFCTVSDYYLICGHPEFVRQACGGSIDSAWRAFRSFAADDWWEGALNTVVVRYARVGEKKKSLTEHGSGRQAHTG